MAARSLSSPTSHTKMPDSRGQAVLCALINEHLVTGEPVGSRTIAERAPRTAGWSAPTIRNVMCELEEAGLVEQPHTSAGRVPTDKGYRFYVDHMLAGQTDLLSARLSKADLAAINQLLGISQSELSSAPSRLMEKTSHLLSALSQNVGIVVSPSLADNVLQHIEFVHLSDKRILVVLISAPNIVQNKIIQLEEELSQEELERTARYLNVEYSGKSLVTIRAEILELMQAEKTLYDTLLQNAILLCDRSLEGEEEATGDVYIDGASNILAKPDFSDVERMRELFRTFEEKSRLVKILSECVARNQTMTGVRVVIGREHVAPSMQSCALITASYRIGDGHASGTLGVVGPVRIEYARMMTVVNYVARLVERLLRDETTFN